MSLIQKIKKTWTNLATKLKSESPWTTIYQSTDEFSIRIKKVTLEDNEIPVRLFDQRDSSYNAFGYIYLNVLKEHVETARKILNLSDEEFVG